MPLYEYRCKKCEHVEEVLQKRGDPAPNTCEACGAKRSMAKEISLTSFQLKGGGWYKDLYSSTPKNDDKKTKTAKKSTKETTKAAKKKPAKKTKAA